MATIGTHCIIELYDCPGELLNDEAFVKRTMRDAAERGLASLLHEVSPQFHPQGVTALGLLTESQISIHTWPEYGYAAADVFTCGEQASAQTACRHLVRAFRAGRHSLVELTRGCELSDEVTDARAERVPTPAQADSAV